ncbi:2OG-Fe dioxygenase family protein [Amycolatopsis sp. NPDC052450]|uniref:2OG-Fe dioxygenase family protein n=1 Tax=Amycolatopsis sp. NPDC052450 TaxID=3363937 RepID=UPI0037CC99CB
MIHGIAALMNTTPWGALVESTTVRSRLFDVGYERYDLAERLNVSESDPEFQALLAEFEDLPADPYATDAGRYRRYARGVMLPWSRTFTWIPEVRQSESDSVNGYFQGDFNPDFAGVVRTLPAMTESSLNNQLLKDIVLFDFDQTTWSAADRAWPLHVGVHLIKLSIDDEEREAISSPNELHQDGEPFVFAHLMYRRNAIGGHNVIAPPRCRHMIPSEISPDLIMAEFELTRPLESYGITDEKVSHYVAPIRKGSSEEAGQRAVVLVDFTVMRQHI